MHPKRPKPTQKNLSSLKRAIALFGGERKDMAEAIGVSKAVVSDWCLAKSAVSIRCAILIEKETDGEIKVSELIPELK